MTAIYTTVWVKEERHRINELSKNMRLQRGRLVPRQLDQESLTMTIRVPRTLQTADEPPLTSLTAYRHITV